MKKQHVILIVMFLILTLMLSYGCGGKKVLSNYSASELFQLGKEQYDQNKYLKSLQYFQTIVYNYPGENIVDSAQYYLALSYFGNEEFELAQVEFNRLALNYPASVYFTHSLFMKAVCFYESTPKHPGLDQSELFKAIKQFEDFIIDYPESDVVGDARNYLLMSKNRLAEKYYNNAIVYVNIGAYQAAERYYQKVVDEYTESEFAALSTFGLADMKFKQHNYEEAKSKYSDFSIVFSGHELAVKAIAKKEEAHFKWAVLVFDNGEYEKAAEIFNQFKKDFPTSQKNKDVDKYLVKINSKPQVN